MPRFRTIDAERLRDAFPDMVWTEHEIKVYAELFRAAERSNKWSRHHRLWIVTRLASRGGCGGTSMGDLLALCAELDGLAPGTVYRYLKEGDGVWWERSRGMVWFRSAKKVALHFEVRLSDPMIMPLPLTLADFRAAATFAFDREWPIANRTIADGIGRTGTTVNNYKKRLGDNLGVRPNWRKTDVKKEIVPEGRYRTVDGEIVEQIPNSYAPRYARPAASGQTRKINRAVNQLLDPVARRTRRKVRYLERWDKIARRMGEREEGDRFFERCGSGRWRLHECRDGQWWTHGANFNFFTPNTYCCISNDNGGKVDRYHRGIKVDKGGIIRRRGEVI